VVVPPMARRSLSKGIAHLARSLQKVPNQDMDMAKKPYFRQRVTTPIGRHHSMVTKLAGCYQESLHLHAPMISRDAVPFRLHGRI
jgi:hypothetical protein